MMTGSSSGDDCKNRRPDAPVPVRSPDGTINHAYLQTLHRIGFKLVPLRMDGTPAVRWTEIREGRKLWDAKYLSENYHLFHNVATAVGPAPNRPPHYPRSNGNPTDYPFVYNAVLDVDGQDVYEKLKEHIERWKQETYVTKSRKPWGYHIHFCTEKPLDDLSGNGYELKARNGLVTLPYSFHRSDPSFTYIPLGVEKIDFWDQARIDELLELLREFGLVETGAQIDHDYEHCCGNSDNSSSKPAAAVIVASYHGSLGASNLNAMANALYSIIEDYYLPNHRNDVTLVYTGVLYRRGVTLDDARQIVKAICSLAGDKEVISRIATLEATYSNRRGAGRPAMARIIQAIKGGGAGIGIGGGHEDEKAAKARAQANDIVGQMITVVRAYVPDPYHHHVGTTNTGKQPQQEQQQQQSLPNQNNNSIVPGASHTSSGSNNGNDGSGDNGDDDGDGNGGRGGDDDNDSGDIPPATKTMRDYLAEFCPELMPTLDRHVYNIITIDDKWARIVIADGNTRTIRLAKIVEKSSGRGDEKQVWHEIVAGDVIAECILTNIKRIEDPLYSEVRWQFGTISHDGKYRQYGPATLETLFQHMGADNLVHKRQVSWFESFSSLLDAYQRAGKVQVIREVKSPGFFIVNDDDDDSLSSGKAKKKVLLACKFDHHDPIREKLVAATEALDHLYQAHYTTELARKKLAHVVKLAVVAPLSFARRQLGVANLNAGFIPGLIMSDESEAGKTYGYGGLVLAINRLDSGEYIRPVRDSGTVARFTHFLSYSTFPIVFDEADYLTESRQQPNIVELIGLLKNAIDKTNSIHLTKNHERVVTYMMGLPILTMNGYAPSEDGLLRRYTVWEFTKNDRIQDRGLIECFNDDISSRLKDALGAIGDFRTQFILEEVNGRGNLDVLAKTKWHELGSIILQRMYEAAGVPYPAWLDEYTSSDQVRTREDVRNERVDGIISCLRKVVGEAWARHRAEFPAFSKDDNNNDNDDGSGTAVVDTYTKLYLLLRHTTSLADFRYDIEKGVIITSSFIETLRKAGVERIGNLKQLAEYTGLNYERIRMNGEQRRYVVCRIKDLADFIDGRRLGGSDGGGGGGNSSSDGPDGGNSSNNNTTGFRIRDASTRPLPPIPTDRELNEIVTKHRVNLVMHVYRELAKDSCPDTGVTTTAGGGSCGCDGMVDEELLVIELCKTGQFLPAWYDKESDHDSNTAEYRMKISRPYAIACISAAVSQGLLERVEEDVSYYYGENGNNNNNTNTVKTTFIRKPLKPEPAQPQPQQQEGQEQQSLPNQNNNHGGTFATISMLNLKAPDIEVIYPPKYRPGDVPAAYGIEYDIKSGNPIDNKRYHIIGVYRGPGRDVSDITWLCPFCAEPDAERSMYYYLIEHIKLTHVYAFNIIRMPLVQNPDEVSYRTQLREFNVKNMKRAYGDTWECTICSRRGDRWYIMDHHCPHFMAAVARPSHSPSSFPAELLEQLLDINKQEQKEEEKPSLSRPEPAGLESSSHSGAIGTAAAVAQLGRPGPSGEKSTPTASPNGA